MKLVGMRRSAHRAVAVAVAGLAALAGCTAEATTPPEARVTALQIEVPVKEPVWTRGAIYALSEETSQVAKIEPIEADETPAGQRIARTTLSEPLPDVGENLATSLKVRGAVYVPQPSLDRVAVLGLRDLRERGTFPAGPKPSHVSVDTGTQLLLALSEDGSTVTGVLLRGFEMLPPREVDAGPEAEVDGAKRGRLVEYHVAGPKGIAHYGGPIYSVEKKHEIGVSAHTSTGDEIKPTRLYVAEEETGHLLAVGTKPALHGMAVAAEADLGEPVEHIGVDATRIYAATENTLVVLETDSYEGYTGRSFSIVDTIDFRTALDREALRSAPLSGLAVGDDRVYLALKGEPYVVSIAKPGI
jgi:hypothetical protein